MMNLMRHANFTDHIRETEVWGIEVPKEDILKMLWLMIPMRMIVLLTAFTSSLIDWLILIYFEQDELNKKVIILLSNFQYFLKTLEVFVETVGGSLPASTGLNLLWGNLTLCYWVTNFVSLSDKLRVSHSLEVLTLGV